MSGALRGRRAGLRLVRFAGVALLFLLILVLLLAAVAWWAGPGLIRAQIEQRGSDALGRAVSVGAVRIDPLALALELQDVAVAGLPGAAPQLQLGRVRADLSLETLWLRAPVLEALTIDAPVLRLARLQPGQLDVDDLVQRLSAASPPGTEPEQAARYALSNLTLTGGQVLVDDRVAGRTHRFEGVRLALPFLSTLPSHVAVRVQPALAFTVAGAQVDLKGSATPFAPTPASEIALRLQALSLAPLWPYLPAASGWKGQDGSLDLDLTLAFEQPRGVPPRVLLKGSAAASGVSLSQVSGPGRVAWRRLALAVDDLQPLRRQAAVSSLQVEGLDVVAPQTQTEKQTQTQVPAAAASASVAEVSWQATLGRLEASDTRIRWRDAASLELVLPTMQLERLAWPADAPSPLRMQARLSSNGRLLLDAAAEGEVSPRSARIAVDLAEAQLAPAQPWLRALSVPPVSGRLEGRVEVDWTARSVTPDAAQDEVLRVLLPQARLRNLSVGAGASPPVRLKALDVADARIDLQARRADIRRVGLREPAVLLQRPRGGDWNLLAWFQPPRVAVASTTPPEAAAASASAPAIPASPRPSEAAARTGKASPSGDWRWRIDEILLSQGRLDVDDAQPATPVALSLRLDELRLRSMAGPPGPTPVAVQLRSRVEVPATEGRAATPPGKLDFSGVASLQPASLEGRAAAERLPVHAVAPWLPAALPVALRRAELGYEGQVAASQRPDGLRARVDGALRVADLQVNEIGSGDELLAWQSLTLAPLRAQLEPGSRPRLEIGRAELSDFSSRLVITEQGRFNLRDVAADPVPGPAAAAPSPAAPSSASASASVRAPAPAPASSAGRGTGLPLDLVVGETVFTRGRIDFRDRFIQPNYSADLTDLNGRLGRVASGSTEMAPLELRGRAAGTAGLEIRGALNPTAEPLALDIAAKATDLELAPLSPYAGKYAGYAIERGKLSLDVNYRIDPDGRLDAKNQLVLNQLTFGERIDSPDATSLPVRFVVALLTDRNGVIDLNLPISGSVNDPQFSLFGLVLKVIGNLLVKAVTAPFSLLSGGDGPDLGQLIFEAGTARIASSGLPALDQAAKALRDRPALKLTITGTADPVEEREAMRAAALAARLAEEQRRDLARAGRPLAADAPAPPLAPAERETLLRRLYEAAPLPDRPRNLIGLLKTVPAAEMEARLRAAVVISTDSARDLALQRSLAVRGALAERGLPVERLFLAAPRVRLAAEGDDTAWVPRAELAVTAN
jgi:uncharacterized protein involved in outer membrane biogenesis